MWDAVVAAGLVLWLLLLLLTLLQRPHFGCLHLRPACLDDRLVLAGLEAPAKVPVENAPIRRLVFSWPVLLFVRNNYKRVSGEQVLNKQTYSPRYGNLDTWLLEFWLLHHIRLHLSPLFLSSHLPRIRYRISDIATSLHLVAAAGVLGGASTAGVGGARLAALADGRAVLGNAQRRGADADEERVVLVVSVGGEAVSGESLVDALLPELEV